MESHAGAAPGPEAIRSVLVVDDDPLELRGLERALRDAGLVVRVARSADEALAQLAAAPPDLAIVDVFLGDSSGLDLLRRLRVAAPALRVVMLTAHPSFKLAIDSIRLGATNYLQKPILARQILDAALRPPSVRLPASPREAQRTLAAAERDHIRRVLLEWDGNVSQAARVLGIHRRSLQRKLRRMNAP
jgi:two-component system response regulator RegA